MSIQTTSTDDQTSCCAPTCCPPDAATTAEDSTAKTGGQDAQQIRDQVRESYAAIARRPATATKAAGCCGPSEPEQIGEGDLRAYTRSLGYSDEELDQIPEGANLGLSCGNPTAIAALQAGETVLDLGSGAGMDAFLAARQVGETGRVIGVDMTPDMLGRARQNAAELGMSRYVEFREGLIEELPVVSESVDVVISNCVINLSTDKPRVFAEAFRVLKPGGRLAVSDVCLTAALPESLRDQAASYAACIGGAMQADDYLQALEEVGFTDVRWTRTPADALLETACYDPTMAESIQSIKPEDLNQVKGNIWSYRIEAHRPAQA